MDALHSCMSNADRYTDLLRSLSPERKLAVAHQLRQTAWELTAAGVRLRHPGLPEELVTARVREIFLRAVT